MQQLDYLILGAGWTSTFLNPLLQSHNLSYAATSTTGRDSTIKFKFDPTNTSDLSYFGVLPHARNILITFPLTGVGQSKLLVTAYKATHHSASSSSSCHPRFMQLGSSGIYQFTASSSSQQQQQESSHWITRHSPHDTQSPRAIAEDELLSLPRTCVLNLSGLWGGSRDPKNWVDRVATTKAQVKSKSSLHMIHGQDVARAIVAVFGKWENDARECEGQRWLVTDGFVYDWWALMAGWAANGGGEEENGEPSRQSKWVFELMQEEGVRALPRSMEALGRCYDTREFWQTFGLSPLRSRI